jgi:hypothetical protein
VAFAREELLEALTRSAGILREAEISFALAGGMAAWALGGPFPTHDLDLLILERDSERALAALAGAGFRTERPSEGWLVKAYHGDVLVDLIFDLRSFPVDEALLESCPARNVHAVEMRVLPADTLLITRLVALTEHELNYSTILEWARALREQIDWDAVSHKTAHSPFARAFLYLLGELGVTPALDLGEYTNSQLSAG